MTEERELEFFETLRLTAEQLSDLESLGSESLAESWQLALALVEDFDPVPWFVRRLTKIALRSSDGGEASEGNKRLNEGAIIGLHKVLFLAVADPIVGAGCPVNSIKEAIPLIKSDVFAAVVVVHAVSRKILARNFDRVWMPILDQALVRAQIGFYVGLNTNDFGAGRGMLAGFAGWIGICILMCRGTKAQAGKTLELLMRGSNIDEVSMEVYACNPLHIGAFLLSLVGCGTNASRGFIVASSRKKNIVEFENREQNIWFLTLSAVEAIRGGEFDSLAPEQWELLGLGKRSKQLEIEQLAHIMRRRGHRWQWMLR